MGRLLFGSYDTKHFHPKLMEYIRDRDDMDAMKMIRTASLEYNPTRLTDNTGSTLLHHAAKEGNEVIAMYLVTLGFNVNAVNHQGETPLTLAVLANHVSTTEILINASSDIYVKVANGKCLVRAVFDGTVPCYSHIIEMFVYKVMREYNDVNLLARALIELKCPLYYVIDMKTPVVTKIMLDNGCAIDAQESRYGNTALHRAVYFKDIENIKLLLKYGADVNVKDNGGRIAWRCAPNLDGSVVELRVLKMLLDRKPTLKSLTANGRMQLYEIFVKGNEAAVKMILQSGIDVSGKDGKGDTVFHYLAMNKNLSGSKLLLDKTYDLNTRNHARLNALHVTAMNRNVGAMKFLLNSGALVDAKTGNTGRTSLFCAIKSTSNVKKSECVELLLERGADVQFVTQSKKTVFDMVKDQNDPVVKTLLAHLAMIEARGTKIVPMIRDRIDNCEEYKNQFNWFKKELEEMKSDKIHESFTLFELLVEKMDDIEKYVRGSQTQLKLKSQNDNCSFDPYYSSLLRKRIKGAMKMVELFD